MPNYCDYDMKIKGSKEAIQRVIDCLKADYNYGVGKPAHKHFFRVFDANEEELVDEGNGVFSVCVWGYCAWSVHSCMLDGAWSYYESVKADHPDIFMGTTLLEQSMDCEIEVFSEETGMGFSEHYLFKNGECLIDDTCDIESAGYDDNGKVTTEIDWDEYGGDYAIINPHRECVDGGFLWEI